MTGCDFNGEASRRLEGVRENSVEIFHDIFREPLQDIGDVEEVLARVLEVHDNRDARE